VVIENSGFEKQYAVINLPRHNCRVHYADAMTVAACRPRGPFTVLWFLVIGPGVDAGSLRNAPHPDPLPTQHYATASWGWVRLDKHTQYE
jgi:hypothetical protein